LSSYATDRRVFEYWVDGDWVAADHLMGKIRSEKALKSEACRNSHAGPCSADHIGPISLGFAHRPEFQFLCKSCNSSKNNRMSLADVRHLLAAEGRGEQVASWYCREVWNLCKGLVTTEEMANRICKILRDNRHTVMVFLGRVARAGHYAFLSTFLGLERADQEPTFNNLRAVNHITAYDSLTTKVRGTKYALEQKARRMRVAFSALKEYVGKENRNAMLVTNDEIESHGGNAIRALDGSPEEVKRLDREIDQVVNAERPAEEQLRALVTSVPTRATEPQQFRLARAELEKAMGLAARVLRSMWDDDRFVREAADEEEATDEDEDDGEGAED
jgi:hypothetical protein